MSYKIYLFILTILTGFTSMAAQTHRGKASYYSKKATGARAASGERIHHDSLTCAHRSYPFGTLLKVINLSNGKEVIVRVTDRGPYGRGRIIDLSYGAAQKLGMLAQGVATVEIKRVDEIKPPFRAEEEPFEMPHIEFGIEDLGDDLTDELTPKTYEKHNVAPKKKITLKTRKPNSKKAEAHPADGRNYESAKGAKPQISRHPPAARNATSQPKSHTKTSSNL